MPVIRLSSGVSFDCAEGTTLLEAAARSSVTLAYGCRTGRCASCKCKVLEGKSHALADEPGLSAQERAEGWILSCVRSAASDMTLEVEDLRQVELPRARILPCRIQTLEKPVPDVLRVTLRLPPSERFPFLPGQHVDVIGPAGVRRSYSLANADATTQRLELHVRAVPGGAMSDYWFNAARVNDLLRLDGPLGTFFLRHVAGLDLVFLATGTGIAPVKAMLEGLARSPAEQSPRSVAVYWGARARADLYWNVEAESEPHVRYVPVLSRASDDWRGARGHVQHAWMARSPDLSSAMVYACGSDAMIQGARQLLLGAGLPRHRFISDAFVCSATRRLLP